MGTEKDKTVKITVEIMKNYSVSVSLFNGTSTGLFNAKAILVK